MHVDSPLTEGIPSLYRYFLIMRRMQLSFEQELNFGDWHLAAQSNPLYLPALIATDPPAIFLTMWQATLYVVIEGWQKLGLNHPHLDVLLKSSNVEALKLHRHGTFHFHAGATPTSCHKLLQSDDSIEWLYKTSEAFSSYFKDINEDALLLTLAS